MDVTDSKVLRAVWFLFFKTVLNNNILKTQITQKMFSKNSYLLFKFNIFFLYFLYFSKK